MTQQTTTAPVDQLDQDDPIAAAEASAQAARDRAAQAKRIQEEANRRIAEANAQLAEAAAEERAAEEAERQAANDRLAAERARMADKPVTLEVAEKLAEDFLDLVEGFRTGGTDRKGQPRRDTRRFWTAIDNMRLRLATPDVAEDARELVLTLEWAIGVCDRWEKSRFRALNSNDRAGSAAGDAPPDDYRFGAVENELRAVLDGEQPKPLERVGELISGRVNVDQMARMLGFVEFGGVPEVDRLGAWVDQAFEAANVERGLRRAVIQYASLNMDDAWDQRQRRVESGVPDHLMPGTVDQPGEIRIGRDHPLVAKSFPPEDRPRTIVVPEDGSIPEDV